MPNRVYHVVGTVDKRCIADIYSIFPGFGDIRLISHDTGLFGLFSCRAHAYCSRLEWIVLVEIHTVALCKSLYSYISPFFLDIHFKISCRGIPVVVIHDYLVALPVAFARSKNACATVFQHRYKIRYDNGLGEQVLCGAEHLRPLPFPSTSLHVIISAMTCPHRDMPVVQSLGSLKWYGNVLYPWVSLVFDVTPFFRGSNRILCQSNTRGNR